MQNMVWSQYTDNTRPERVVIPETVDDFCKVRVEEIREVWERVTGEVGLAQVVLLADFF
jgi:hypothetical protein